MSDLMQEHEVFENERWSGGAWGSDYPEHLLEHDPPKYSTRNHQRLPGTEGAMMDAWACFVPGWEWTGDWRKDIWHASSCDPEGWQYANDFATLARQLVARSYTADGGERKVRWRRWVRPRKRVSGTTIVRPIRGYIRAPGGWKEGIPHSAIIHEGWLAKFREGDGWLQSWCVLMHTADGQGSVLLYCDSLESMKASDAVLCPPACFLTNGRPPVLSSLALVISDEQLRCCFAIGTSRDGEGLLHAAASEAERAQWMEKLSASHGDEASEAALDFANAAAITMPRAASSVDELCLTVLGATGLPSTERDGTTDPYCVVRFKGGQKTQEKKTAYIKGTCNPRWDRHFTFEGVQSELAELQFIVKDHNHLMRNEPLGEVSFPLKEWDLPRSGALVTLVLALHAVSEGRTKRPVQGELRLQIGWCRMGALVGQATGSVPMSPETKGVIEQALYADLLGDEASPEGPEQEEASTAQKEEEEAQAEAIERAKRIEEEELASMKITPQKGEYQLHVHVIEGRELVGRDSNGVSDPAVVISAFGQERRTATKYKQSSPLWDEHVFITSKELNLDELNKSQINVAVYDMDLVSRDLVGQFNVDALSVYYKPHHELWQTWVTLSAPYDVRKRFFGQDAAGGVQGYLKLCITLLGPNDKAKIHGEDEDTGGDLAGSVLLPPSMRRYLVFLRVSVICASHLPKMDSTGTAGIDAYVKIRFNGYKRKTKVVTSRHPVWMTSFFMPILVPSIGGQAIIEVRDRDVGKADDHVGAIAVRFDEVWARYKRGDQANLSWHHLYAMGDSARATGGSGGGYLMGKYKAFRAHALGKSTARREIRQNTDFYVSEWRGKLLLSVGIMKPKKENELPEKAMERPISRPPGGSLPKPAEGTYELRMAVIWGSELSFKGDGEQDGDGVYLEAVVEHHIFNTAVVKPQRGFAFFLATDVDASGRSPGVFRKVNTDELLVLPTDPEQLPTVFVYLCNSKGKRIAFHSFQGAELTMSSGCFAPSIITMRPTAPVKSGTALPSLAISASLSLLPSDAPSSPREATQQSTLELMAWPPPPTVLPLLPTLQPYEVRLHVYQGRNLPARDENGALDPYVVASICGVSLRSDNGKHRTAVQRKTSHPTWYQTLRIAVWLPPLGLAPDLLVRVWDRDIGALESDDFVGEVRLSLRHTVASADANASPLPRWIELGPSGLEGGGGEVLLRAELLPRRMAQEYQAGFDIELPDDVLEPLDRIPALMPAAQRYSLRIAVIGMRGVRMARQFESFGSSMTSEPSRPFVEFEVGSQELWQIKRTLGSNKPSAVNPSFTSQAPFEMKLELPVDSLFMPALKVTVRDTLFGGLRTPELGVAFIPLLDLRNDSSVVSVRPALQTVAGALGTAVDASSSSTMVTVETWENERWYPGKGWTALMLPSDPPHWSSAAPPYKSTPREDESGEFGLPSNNWLWLDEWHVHPKDEESTDKEGYQYALHFHTSCPNSFSDYEVGDMVRRRRWVRTRTRRPERPTSPTRSQGSDQDGSSSSDEDEQDNLDLSMFRSRRRPPPQAQAPATTDATPGASVGASLGAEDSTEGCNGVVTSLSNAERAMLHPMDALSPEEQVTAIKEQLKKLHEKNKSSPVTLEEKLRAQFRHEKIKKLERALKKAEDAAVDAEIPSYMRKRHKTREYELERDLEQPFSTIAVMSGQDDTQVKVASLKAIMRLVPDGEELPRHDRELLMAIMSPRAFVVRVYILRGNNLAHLDPDSPSDPYLRLSLGSTKLDNRAEYVADETNVHFHRMFELQTSLPGDSLLQIDVMDHDNFGRMSDDLIGSTTIDLEDRVFSQRWAETLADAPPVETRYLYSPLSKRPQGSLELWVDILRSERAKVEPPIDISLAPEQIWELRIVCWGGKNLPRNVDDSGLADWYVTCKFADCSKQHTDTHFRAARGKASWNWRFKFPVCMSTYMKHQRVLIQLWDRDITADDCGGEAVIDLTRPWFKRVFARKRARPSYWEPFNEESNLRIKDDSHRIVSAQEMKMNENKFTTLLDVAEEVMSKESLLANEVDKDLEEAKFWLPLQRPMRETQKQRDSDAKGGAPMLLLSVQLVPQSDIEKLPAGFGRSEPNANPKLPKPTGRLTFTWNPCVMLYKLLGPKLCRRLSGALGAIVCLVLLWYMIPVILANAITSPFTG